MRLWTVRPIWFVMLAVWMLQGHTVAAAVTQVSNWDALKPLFKDLAPNSLVVLDVDWTLIVPCDRVLQPNIEPWAGELMQQASERARRPWDDEALSRLHLGRQAKLLDPMIPALLSAVPKQKAHAIALTALGTGAYGVITNLERWRCKELRSLGLDFKPLAPTSESRSFYALMHMGRVPVLRRGILFSAGRSKGEVLAAFLTHMQTKHQWQPSEVIFIDDNPGFMASVEGSMQARNMPFRGFYLVHPKKQLTPPEIESSIQQMTYFLQTGHWLNDRQTRAKFKRAKKER